MRLADGSRRAAAGAFVFLLAACSSKPDAGQTPDYAAIMAFDTATIRVIGRDTARLTVQLAETEPQRTMGLMERRSLPADAGMLFLYSTVQPDSSAFWMFRTRIPLDIAFIDSTGTIRTVLTMPPCPSDLAQGCPSYPAAAAFTAALEVNAGYFAAHHIAVGDRVLLSDTTTRRRAAAPSNRSADRRAPLAIAAPRSSLTSSCERPQNFHRLAEFRLAGVAARPSFTVRTAGGETRAVHRRTAGVPTRL